MPAKIVRIAKTASELKESDYIINVGIVNTPPKTLGVFILVETYTTEWSIMTGKGETVTKLHIFHDGDTVEVSE